LKPSGKKITALDISYEPSEDLQSVSLYAKTRFGWVLIAYWLPAEDDAEETLDFAFGKVPSDTRKFLHAEQIRP
jgi:hypothetical protein